MNFFLCDFEPVIEKVNKDIWDEVYKSLNNNDNSNIQKTIGTINEGSGKFPRFTESMMKAYFAGNADLARAENRTGFEFVLKNNNQGKYKFHEDGSLEYISFYDEALKDYTFDKNHIQWIHNILENKAEKILIQTEKFVILKNYVLF